MKTLRFLAAFALSFPLFATAAPPPPANDGFSVTTGTVNGNLGVVTGSNRGATNDFGEPDHGGRISTTSVWYRWTPTFSGPARVETHGSSFDTILAVYTGTTFAGLTTIGTNDDFSGINNASRVDFTATSGTEYRIAVTGFNSAVGDIMFSYGAQSDPAQFRALPQKVSEGAGSAVVTIVRLLNDTGSVTATYDTSGFAPTATSGSDYTATASSVTFTPGQRSKAFTISVLQDAVAEQDEGIPVSFDVTAGSGTDYIPQENAITILDDERPVNDNFAAAIQISGEEGNTPITTQGASAEVGEPVDYKFETPHTVWYRWTAPRTAAVAWFGTGSTTARLYTGSAVNALTLAPPAGRAIGVFRVVQGTEYMVQADAYLGSSTVNNGTLNWQMYEPGTFQFNATSVVGFKSAGIVSLKILRTVGADTAETLFVQSTNGTASSPADYSSVFEPVEFAAGDTEKTVDIALRNTSLAANGATFTVTLSSAGSGTIGANSVATVTLWDNDSFANAYPLPGASGELLGTVGAATLEPAEPRHGDAQGVQEKTVWFTWVAPTNGPFVFSNTASEEFPQFVQMSAYTGNAVDALTRVADGDSPAIGGFGGQSHLAFLATSGTTYRIGVRDYVNEGSERFPLKWEPASAFTLSQGSYTISESSSSLTVTVNRTGPITEAATVLLSAIPGTAGVNDFEAGTTSLQFAPNATSLSLQIPITNDAIHEIPETFTVSLSRATGNGYVAHPPASIVTITSDDTFSAKAGTFCGTVSLGATAAQNGAVKATLTVAGKLTGSLTFGGKKYPLSGALNAAGNVTFTIARKAPAAPLTLVFESTANNGRLVATLSDGTNTEIANADKLPFDAKNNIAPSFGAYTAFIGNVAGFGDGTVLASVALNGVVKLTGQLADGTPFTASAPQAVIPETGLSEVYCPLHIPLYKGAGYLAGELHFGTALDYQLRATLRWVKPALPKEKYYPTAFDITPELLGGRYTVPAAGNRLVALQEPGSFQLEIGGGGVANTSGTAYLLVNNFVNTAAFTSPQAKLTIAAKTGLVATAITLPAVKPIVLKGKAIILQNSNELRGHFLNPTPKTSGDITGAF